MLLVGLALCVNVGFHFRRGEKDTDSQIESARDGLNLLLSLLLGFTLPMAQPHYDHRKELIVDEANAIATVQVRAEMLPAPYRENVLAELREYLDSRIDYAKQDFDAPGLRANLAHSNRLQSEMQQQTVLLVQQSSNSVTPIFVQALNQLGDVVEKRLSAEENRIPAPIWLMIILIAMMACLITGYCMRRRLLLEMLVLPLTVAIVLALVAELDSPRTGLIRVGQESMVRLQTEMNSLPTQSK